MFHVHSNTFRRGRRIRRQDSGGTMGGMGETGGRRRGPRDLTLHRLRFGADFFQIADVQKRLLRQTVVFAVADRIEALWRRWT
jgi:hypothetical protein